MTNCLRISILLLVAVVVTILVQGSSSSVDPCSSYIAKGDSRRTTTEDPGVCGGGLCDNDIGAGQWYRLDAYNSGARMPEACVKVYHCGTYIPVWLNGAHPIESAPGPVSVRVCAQLRNDGDCCEWSNTVDAKWCKDGTVQYYVYRLAALPYCDMAYCAGNGINCPNEGSWNDVIQNCSSSRFPTIGADPILSLPYTSPGATTFSLRCTLSYTKLSKDDGSRYDVVFNTTSGVVFSTTLKSTDTPEVELSASSLVGHLDQDVVCSVTAYWSSDTPNRSEYKKSASVYIGFKFTDTSTNRPITDSVAVREGDKVKVKVEPTFPFASSSYSFRLRSSQLYLSTCSISIANWSSTTFVYSPIANTENLQRTGNFYMTPESSIQTRDTILNGYTSKTYQISIIERSWGTCSSTGDPHIFNFNRDSVELQDPAPYILTSIPSKKIEVQTKHTSWSVNPLYYTNCGVIAREGNNIIGIDYCPPLQSPTFNRYLRDANNPGGYITSANNMPNSPQTIVLPSGMRIVVSFVAPGYIDLQVNTYGLESDTFGGTCSKSSPTKVQGVSFFDIRQNMPQPPCINDALLVPQCDCSTVGTTSCPSLNGAQDYSNTCHTPPLQTRRKRQTGNSPTTPAATPPQTPTHQWPTPIRRITEQQANDSCNNALRKSAVYDLCINQLKLDVSAYFLSCVLDIQLTENITASTMFISTLTEFQCSSYITNLNDTNAIQEYKSEFQSKVCPGQCRGNGICDQGTCRCNTGYMNSDCSLPTGTVPTIVNLPSNSCDIRDNATNGCTSVYVSATNVSDTDLVCKITNAVEDSAKPLTSIDASPEANYGFVLCHLPLLPVSLSLSRDWTVCSYSVSVSLSNDGVHYSNAVIFRVYDCSAACLSTKWEKCTGNRNASTFILLLAIIVLHQLMRLSA